MNWKPDQIESVGIVNSPPRTAIEIHALNKTYYGKNRPIKAVENLSLFIPAGQVFGFLRPNGAGNPAAIEPPEGPDGAAMSRTPSVRNHPKGGTG